MEAEYVHFKLVVPRHYMRASNYWEDGADAENSDDDEVSYEEEVEYTTYACQGRRGQTLGEAVGDAALLKSMGVVGRFEVIHRAHGGFGRDRVFLSLDMQISHVVRTYVEGDGACILELRPALPLWFKCRRLSEREIVAARQVIRQREKRPCKKPRLTPTGEEEGGRQLGEYV